MTEEQAPQVRVRMGDGETNSAKSSTIEAILPLNLQHDIAQQIRDAVRIVEAELVTAELTRRMRDYPKMLDEAISRIHGSDLLHALEASVEQAKRKGGAK